MAKKKPVRVNLSTPTADILATMREEKPKAQYFFRKQFGSKDKYLKAEQAMIDKAMAEERDQFSDMSYYISPVGNRWICYTHVVYYPRAKVTSAFRCSFIYYETIGSCGAFFPAYSDKVRKGGAVMPNTRPDQVIIFTSHFFYQMSERTGIEYRSKELIREFISTRCANVMTIAPDGSVITKFTDGHGFGRLMGEEPMRMEVRTYLTDAQLTNKQRKNCQQVDDLYELTKDGMMYQRVAMHTAFHQAENPEAIKAEVEKTLKIAKRWGLEDDLKKVRLLGTYFVDFLEDHFNANIDEKAAVVIASCIRGELWKVVAQNDGITDTAIQRRNVCTTFVKCTHMLGLKGVDAQTVENIFQQWEKEAEQ